ncbi:hypothetical protein BDV93DRAFT_298845 [Ceratobasidium sp. AG-I]|nr:hypothetical protein BDV93DRAFT_298845 [Ceratobasidium sp. AG-I]
MSSNTKKSKCTVCKNRKNSRCDFGQPCSWCAKRQLDCVYESAPHTQPTHVKRATESNTSTDRHDPNSSNNNTDDSHDEKAISRDTFFKGSTSTDFDVLNARANTASHRIANDTDKPAAHLRGGAQEQEEDPEQDEEQEEPNYQDMIVQILANQERLQKDMEKVMKKMKRSREADGKLLFSFARPTRTRTHTHLARLLTHSRTHYYARTHAHTRSHPHSHTNKAHMPHASLTTARYSLKENITT